MTDSKFVINSMGFLSMKGKMRAAGPQCVVEGGRKDCRDRERDLDPTGEVSHKDILPDRSLNLCKCFSE